jgi:hypothetical protein
MDFFTIGLITLFVSTAIFYIVLFSFIYYWHLVKATFITVPMVFAFEFFAAGFFIVALVSIILQYLPDIIRISGI